MSRKKEQPGAPRVLSVLVPAMVPASQEVIAWQRTTKSNDQLFPFLSGGGGGGAEGEILHFCWLSSIHH